MNTIDVYKFFKNHPAFNKLVGDDYLFVEYKCPINADQFKLWSESVSYTHLFKQIGGLYNRVIGVGTSYFTGER